jgi:hypothetical protein
MTSKPAPPLSAEQVAEMERAPKYFCWRCRDKGILRYTGDALTYCQCQAGVLLAEEHREHPPEPEPPRAFCVHGHPWTPENIYVLRGHPYCRLCGRNRSRELYYKKKERSLGA